MMLYSPLQNIRRMEMEFILSLAATNTKENGKIIKGMDKELKLGQTVTNKKENGKTIKRMEKEL